MEYIKKQDLLKIFQALADSRAGKNCSRTKMVEYQIYQYVLNIINTIKTYEYEEQ